MKSEPTSDGIPASEWSTVRALAIKIANAASADQDRVAERFTNELLQYLDQLEARHGKLPSIIATRADYTDDASARIALLKEAWCLAERLQDVRNLVFISSSLAEAYLDAEDAVNAQQWVDCLEDAVANSWNDDEFRKLGELKRQLSRLQRNCEIGRTKGGSN